MGEREAGDDGKAVAARSDFDGDAKPSPDEALARLVAGNRDFANDVPSGGRVGQARRSAISGEQTPFAVCVTCSDSRVPPELLFSCGLGELFVIRNAGNTLGPVAFGSVEYAVAQLGVSLIVVMGHENCGAVRAALGMLRDHRPPPGEIGESIAPIIPAIVAADVGLDDLERAVKANIAHVVRQLRSSSDPIMSEPQRAGRLKVVGGYYALDSGRVDFFDPF